MNDPLLLVSCVVLYLTVGMLLCLWADSSPRFGKELRGLPPAAEVAVWALWPVALPWACWRYLRATRAGWRLRRRG